jgi:phosphatidylglycerophosphate synthase
MIKLGFGPNVVSLIGFFFSFLALFSFYEGKLIFATLFTFLNGLFDGIDGEIARALGETKFGAFLDSVLDRLSDGVLILGVCVYIDSSFSYILGLFTLLGFVLVSYTPVKKGGMGRSERLLILIAFTILDKLLIGLLILCILTNATVISRSKFYP